MAVEVKRRRTPIASAEEWRFIEAMLADPAFRTLYLWGLPGVGKTYCAYHNGRIMAGVFPVTLTPEMPASELMGHYFPFGQELRWRDGPFTCALRAGGRLVINEITHASSDVLAILYPVLESVQTAQLMLPNNEVVRPAPGFHVVVTDNEPPENLPLALQDRFDAQAHIRSPHPDALAQLSPELQRAALRAMCLDDERRITMRQWLNIGRFAEKMGLKDACRAVLGIERGTEIYDALKLAARQAQEEKSNAR